MMDTGTASTAGCQIVTDNDVIVARQLGRRFAETLGFARPDQALIATAISELARNVVNYTDGGRVEITEVHHGRRTGLQVTVTDRGPGIADIDLAMTDGYSTGKSLGLGLPGTKRMVDEFAITSEPGFGVTVSFIKWVNP